jgi:type I restriction enzyme S subunit
MINNEYKNTELGLLPDDWKITCLGDINTEKNQNVSPLKDEIYEYYSIPAYQENNKPEIVKGSTILSQKKILKENMILFGKLNPRVEKVWKVGNYSNYKKIGSGEWITIFPNPYEVSAEYLFYLELSKFVMPIAKTLVTGSTPSRQRVDPTSFYKLKVPLPPLKEQQKIAYVLSTVQQAQEKTDRVINSLKELKKSMMKHLFTYGITNSDNTNEVRLQKSEFGDILSGWKIENLESLGKFQYGYTETANKAEVGPKFLRITDIDLETNQVKWESVPYCTISNGDFDKFKLNDGDILVARIGATTGKTYLARNPPKAVFASYLIRFTPSKNINPDFVYHYTLSDLYKNQVNRNKGGKLKGGLSASVLNKFKIPTPSVIEQKQISTILNTMEDKIKVEEQKREALEQLFKSLLSNLMSAKIRVNDLKVS